MLRCLFCSLFGGSGLTNFLDAKVFPLSTPIMNSLLELMPFMLLLRAVALLLIGLPAKYWTRSYGWFRQLISMSVSKRC